MNTNFDNQMSFYALQEATKTGWWHANITQGTITISSYLMDLIGRETETLSLEAFIRLIRPDIQMDARKEMLEFSSHFEDYDEKLLINTPNGYLNVHIKSVSKVTNKNREEIIEGFLKYLEDNTTPQKLENPKAHLKKLLDWQHSITETLLGLLDKSSGNEPIQSMLDIILKSFEAKEARIFSFDHPNKVFTCEYESVADDVAPAKHILINIPFEKGKWLHQILEKKPVFLDEVNETIPRDKRHTLSSQFNSSMIIPLLSKQGVWGFMRIDAPDKKKGWNHIDREAFMAVANVIGVCLTLLYSEQILTDNSDFLHKLYQNMPIGYLRIQVNASSDGKVTAYECLDVNTRFAEMTGLNREQLIGKINSVATPVFTTEIDSQVLFEVAYKDRVYEKRMQAIRGGDCYDAIIYAPQPGNIVALFSDITEAVRATEALRKRGEELKRIYTNLPVGIEVYDEEGYMIEVNDQVLAMEKVSDKEDLIGLNLFDHPSLPEHARELLKQGKDVTFDINLEAMKTNREYYGIDSQDDLKYLTLKCTVLHNAEGKTENYLLIIIDNTKMYETSERLNEFESAFNSIAEIAEVGFFRWNPLRKTYFSSEQSYRNMGIKAQGDMGLSFENFFHLIHPDDAKPLAEFMEDALAGRRTSHTFEFRIRYGKGWKWLRGTSRVIEYDPAHQNIQFIGLNYSIDKMKKAEQKLLEAKLKAEESDRLKSAFLASISHEIRTPLNAIVGFSEVLADAEDEDEKQQYISIIKKNNEHLLNLITDIIDLSQIESGNMEISKSEILVDNLCEQAISPLSVKIPEEVELHFKQNKDGKGLTIQNDPKWIMQILSILLSNAIKFTRHGHIWLSYKLLPREIEFSVKDTGIGIPPEERSKIFERFVKLDEFVPGTGLGLTICKSIVHKLGGTIGVDSKIGEGSRFWFRLPW